MKKITRILLLFAVILFALSFTSLVGKESVYATTDNNQLNGSCGENITYTLNSFGTLTLTGSGEMYNFSNAGLQPWYAYADSIRSVVIGDGITYIGGYSFSYCDNLKYVFMPDSVTEIGQYAFYSDSSLTYGKLYYAGDEEDLCRVKFQNAISDKIYYYNGRIMGSSCFAFDVICCNSFPTEYNITYHNVNGWLNTNPTVNYTSAGNVTLSNPTVATGNSVSIAFDGWYLDSEFTYPVSAIPAGTLGDIDLYAKYNITEYNVNYYAIGDFDEGEYELCHTSAEACAAFNSHIAPTVRYFVAPDFSEISSDIENDNRYTPIGWSTTPNSSVAQYAFGESYLPLTQTDGGEINLYAVYKPNHYIVEFITMQSASDGSWYMICDYGTTYQIPNCNNPVGYVFTGWKLNNTSTDYEVGDDFADLVSANTYYSRAVFEAQCSPISYTVRFDGNGGNSLDDVVLSYGNIYYVQDTTRNGYNFLGWNTSADGNGTSYVHGGYISNLSATDGDVVTLYAQWQPRSYTLAFDANGGTGSMASIDCLYGITTVLPECTFERPGYDFIGWAYESRNHKNIYDYSDGFILSGGEIGATHTIYAIWRPHNYTIDFDMNGCNASLESMTCFHETTYSLRNHRYWRCGYTFIGWNTERDGSGTSYCEEATVTDLVPIGTNSITLYAQWQPITYMVVFEPYDGIGTPVTMTCTYDVEYTAPSVIFERESYCLVGWCLGRDSRSPWTQFVPGGTFSNLSYIQGDVVSVCPVWRHTYYSIILNGNGETSTSEAILTGRQHGVAYPVTNYYFSKPGYHFIGWNTEADGTGTFYAAGEDITYNSWIPDDTLTLYAMWEANE